jgi:hypothetical protein
MAIDRNAGARAKFFLALAEQCDLNHRNEFEAFVEASILFARSAILRAERKYKNHPNFKPWWQNLLKNPVLNALRDERNLVVHEAPPKVGQVIGGSGVDKASSLYFYETDANGKPVDIIRTLSAWVAEAENTAKQADSLFK